MSTNYLLPQQAITSNKSSIGEFCLAKTMRLRTPADFQRVYASKQWGGSKYFTFNVLANDLNQQNTLGVTVSKKVSKRAVDRNALKRVMREFFRLRQNELNGVNLVLTAKPNSRNATKEQSLQSLEELWVKLLKWQRWYQRELIKSTGLAASQKTKGLPEPVDELVGKPSVSR